AGAVCAPLLAGAGTDRQRSEWLPVIASGDAVPTVQLGGAPFAVDADVADLLILERDGELHAIPRGGFMARRVRTEDGARRIFEIDTDTGASTRMAGDSAAAADAFRRGAAATAAVLNGVAARLLELTLEHVKARHQFGRPVGSFQAVKHKLAAAHVMVESSRGAAWYAAYAMARGLPDRHVAVS